ncbi:MAG: tRNA pseudouridine(38-40) synthase TruA [Burkholderiaceae bacterium]|jgi:tRNA pseudouridine38-40 synthase|nr:tRNA pseudouridine(38-40) synthase TruA [Burkholderiaceae bacterium]
MRIALGLEYDGSRFTGWQTQPGGTAVQDAVERALREFVGTDVATVCAGRTDAGVHASYQVVHLDTEVIRPLDAWVRGVNAQLPSAVAVRWSREVPAVLHARFSATGRRYDYWLLNDPVRSPLAHGRVGWVFRPLDESAMHAAAQALVGQHDFTSFRAAECQAKSPVRELRQCDVQRFGRLIRIRVAANAFLHHMVRNLVGTLVYVGLGRQSTAWPVQVLAARDRAQAAPTFAAEGLYLTHVQYDPAFDLPPPADTLPLLA